MSGQIGIDLTENIANIEESRRRHIAYKHLLAPLILVEISETLSPSNKARVNAKRIRNYIPPIVKALTEASFQGTVQEFLNEIQRRLVIKVQNMSASPPAAQGGPSVPVRRRVTSASVAAAAARTVVAASAAAAASGVGPSNPTPVPKRKASRSASKSSSNKALDDVAEALAAAFGQVDLAHTRRKVRAKKPAPPPSVPTERQQAANRAREAADLRERTERAERERRTVARTNSRHHVRNNIDSLTQMMGKLGGRV
jgi:hypothetical protein